MNLIKPEFRFNRLISEHRKTRLHPGSRPVYSLDYDFSFLDVNCPKCGLADEYCLIVIQADFVG